MNDDNVYMYIDVKNTIPEPTYVQVKEGETDSDYETLLRKNGDVILKIYPTSTKLDEDDKRISCMKIMDGDKVTNIVAAVYHDCCKETWYGGHYILNFETLYWMIGIFDTVALVLLPELMEKCPDITTDEIRLVCSVDVTGFGSDTELYNQYIDCVNYALHTCEDLNTFSSRRLVVKVSESYNMSPGKMEKKKHKKKGKHKKK